ncbi:MAG: ABC transporter permease, partial [Gemmatimonadota bacterium]
MTPLVKDLRHALRALRRSPSFAFTAVLTLALGIGATVSIFSVVKTVLLDPLPYDSPEELVVLWEHHLPSDDRSNVANPGNVRDWRERSTSLADIAAAVLPQPVTVTGLGEPEEIMSRIVTRNYFDVLGLDAAVGRTFSPDPDETGDTEVVLSDAYWRERFGADRSVIGRTVTVNGASAVVVGVMPPEYVVFGEEAQAWLSWRLIGDQTNTGRFLNVIGRLADGATVERARQEVSAIATQLQEEHPDFNGNWSARVVPLQAEVVGDVRTALWVLLGAVASLLLIGCANVANLFLARATTRRRELAVRTSLGATGGGLARLLLAESVVLAGIGAAAGVGLAQLGTRLIAVSLPDAFALPRVEATGLDGTVLLFAVGLSVATALLFGLAPALQAMGLAPAETLNAEARGPSRRTLRTRSALVVGEVALAVMLLGGAALLGRSFQSLVSVDSGFEAEDVLTARVTLSGPAYEESDEAGASLFTEFNDRLARLPGVEVVGGVPFLPMKGFGSATRFVALDGPIPPQSEWPNADIRTIVGDYFDAMGIRLLRGRTFTESDVPDSRDVAIVNRALAESQWPDENPIGKRIGIGWGERVDVEVVGVADDVLLDGLDAEADPAIYLPYVQKPWFGLMHFAVRTSGGGDPAALTPALAAELRELDPEIPLADARLMADIVADSVSRPRLTTLLMSIFAGLAVLLAAVGLYGVLSYSVAQRTREIGIRMALGARVGDVLSLVTRQGMTVAGIGLLLGLGGALAAGRLLEALLFDIESTDPVSLGAAALLLA